MVTSSSGGRSKINFLDINDNEWKEFNDKPKWRTTVRGADDCLYGIPYHANRVVRFDPTKNSMVPIGMDLGKGLFKYCHGILAVNGYIYCAPDHADSVLKIDTNPDPDCCSPNYPLVSKIGKPFTCRNNGNWISGTIAMNGKLYFMPFRASHILEVDPYDDSVMMVGPDLGNSLTRKYYKTIGALNGYVYGSHNDGSLAKFHPDQPEDLSIVKRGIKKSSFLEIDGRTYDLSKSVKGEDGCFYYDPKSEDNCVRVWRHNTHTKTWSRVATLDRATGTGRKWGSGAVASNGIIYYLPCSADKILKIDTTRASTWYSSKVGGVTDKPQGVPDRLDYGVYARALGTVVRSMEEKDSSVCVALYAPWGAGKSTLYYLIRDNYDCYEPQDTKENEKNASILWESVSIACNASCFVYHHLLCCLRIDGQAKAEIVATVMIFTFPVALVIFVFTFIPCLLANSHFCRRILHLLLLCTILFKYCRCGKFEEGMELIERRIDDFEQGNANIWKGKAETHWCKIKKILTGETDVCARFRRYELLTCDPNSNFAHLFDNISKYFISVSKAIHTK